MTTQGNGDLSRRGLMKSLAVAGGAMLLGGATVLATPSQAHAAADRNFRWCRRCQSLWFIAGGNNGHCPVHHWWDHNHYQDGSAIYGFIDVTRPAFADDSFGQILLKWCLTCKAAYFWQHPASVPWQNRVCPNNSAGHTPSASTYRIEMEQRPPLSSFRKQADWRRCANCKVLYFIGNGEVNTRCSAHGPLTEAHSPAWIDTPSGWQHERYLLRF